MAKDAKYPLTSKNSPPYTSTLRKQCLIKKNARVLVAGIGKLNKAKKATLKAMEIQKEGRGFAMAEYMVSCPSGRHMTPVESHQWIESTMEKQYPLGVFRDR